MRELATAQNWNGLLLRHEALVCDYSNSLRFTRVVEKLLPLKSRSRTIFRWVEAERLHFSETPHRARLICINSLS